MTEINRKAGFWKLTLGSIAEAFALYFQPLSREASASGGAENDSLRRSFWCITKDAATESFRLYFRPLVWIARSFDSPAVPHQNRQCKAQEGSRRLFKSN